MMNFRLCGSGSNELQVHTVRNEKQSDQGFFRVKSVEVIEEDCREQEGFVPKHLYNLKEFQGVVNNSSDVLRKVTEKNNDL